MYDRVLSLGRFAERPLVAAMAPAPVSAPLFGPPVRRGKAAAHAVDARPARRDP